MKNNFNDYRLEYGFDNQPAYFSYELLFISILNRIQFLANSHVIGHPNIVVYLDNIKGEPKREVFELRMLDTGYREGKNNHIYRTVEIFSVEGRNHTSEQLSLLVDLIKSIENLKNVGAIRFYTGQPMEPVINRFDFFPEIIRTYITENNYQNDKLTMSSNNRDHSYHYKIVGEPLSKPKPSIIKSLIYRIKSHLRSIIPQRKLFTTTRSVETNNANRKKMGNNLQALLKEHID